MKINAVKHPPCADNLKKVLRCSKKNDTALIGFKSFELKLVAVLKFITNKEKSL